MSFPSVAAAAVVATTIGGVFGVHLLHFHRRVATIMPTKMTDQEDPVYCITFPSFPPSPKDPTLTSSVTSNGQDHKEEFVFVYEEDKRPLVVLLGWAGCQDRYLAKYSAIYEEKR